MLFTRKAGPCAGRSQQRRQVQVAASLSRSAAVIKTGSKLSTIPTAATSSSSSYLNAGCLKLQVAKSSRKMSRMLGNGAKAYKRWGTIEGLRLAAGSCGECLHTGAALRAEPTLRSGWPDGTLPSVTPVRRMTPRMCGIIGIFKHEGDASIELYEGLLMLQHRGQDSAGMVTTDWEKFKEFKENGLVKDVFADKKVLESLKGAQARVLRQRRRTCYADSKARIWRCHSIASINMQYDAANCCTCLCPFACILPACALMGREVCCCVAPDSPCTAPCRRA